MAVIKRSDVNVLFNTVVKATATPIDPVNFVALPCIIKELSKEVTFGFPLVARFSCLVRSYGHTIYRDLY